MFNMLSAWGFLLVQVERIEKAFEWESLLCYFGDGFRKMVSIKLLSLWTLSRLILVVDKTRLM